LSVSRYGALLTFCVSMACGAFPAAAETPCVEDNDVEVRIGAVLASHQGRSFDQRLISLRRQFDSLFPYSSYQLVREERRRLSWKRQAEFRLPGGRRLIVVPREYKNGRVSLNLVFVQGFHSLFNTQLSLRNDGTVLVGGPTYKDGVLIVAIGARTVP
jgi:hypothetical protein